MTDMRKYIDIINESNAQQLNESSEAFKAGYDNGYRKKSNREECPYERGSKEWNDFMRGMEFGMEEWNDRMRDFTRESNENADMTRIAAEMVEYLEDYFAHYEGFPMDIEVDDVVYDWDQWNEIVDTYSDWERPVMKEEQIDEISDFKRREIEWELRHEEEEAKQQARIDRGTHVMVINGKTWMKAGKPVEFKNKNHGLNVMKKIAANKPDAIFHILPLSKIDIDGTPLIKLTADGKVIFDPKAGK